jgi:hypothetical protein
MFGDLWVTLCIGFLCKKGVPVIRVTFTAVGSIQVVDSFLWNFSSLSAQTQHRVASRFATMVERTLSDREFACGLGDRLIELPIQFDWVLPNTRSVAECRRLSQSFMSNAGGSRIPPVFAKAGH